MFVLVGTTGNQKLIEATHKPSIINVMHIRFGMDAELSKAFIEAFFDTCTNFLLVDLNDYVSGVEMFNSKFMKTLVADNIPDLMKEIGKIKQYIFVYGFRSYGKEKYVFDYYNAMNINCPPLRKFILDDILADLK